LPAAPYLKLVWFHAQRTAWKSSQRALDQAIAADPADPRGAAYAGALAMHQEKPDEAIGWFAAAAALDEANARLRGTTLRGGAGPWLGPEEAGRMLATQLALAELCLKAKRSDQALHAARDAATLEGRFAEDTLYERPASAMFPRPFEAGDVPQAPNVVYLLAMLNVRWGQAADLKGDPAQADAAYARVLRIEANRSAVRDIGSEIQTPIALAKFAGVKRLVAQKKWDEAHTAMMGVGRPWGLPKDIEAEIRALEEEINNQREALQEQQDAEQRRPYEEMLRKQQEEVMKRREEGDRQRQDQRGELMRRRGQSGRNR
jgi:hypothetical protein